MRCLHFLAYSLLLACVTWLPSLFLYLSFGIKHFDNISSEKCALHFPNLCSGNVYDVGFVNYQEHLLWTLLLLKQHSLHVLWIIVFALCPLIDYESSFSGRKLHPNCTFLWIDLYNPLTEVVEVAKQIWSFGWPEDPPGSKPVVF